MLHACLLSCRVECVSELGTITIHKPLSCCIKCSVSNLMMVSSSSKRFQQSILKSWVRLRGRSWGGGVWGWQGCKGIQLHAEKVCPGRTTSSKDQAVVIYFFFWLLYNIFLCNENAWTAFQGNTVFSNFLGGAFPQTPLEVCSFTAHPIHPHPHENSWLHASGGYLRFSTWKENRKDYTLTAWNQDANTSTNKMRQALQTVKTVMEMQ